MTNSGILLIDAGMNIVATANGRAYHTGYVAVGHNTEDPNCLVHVTRGAGGYNPDLDSFTVETDGKPVMAYKRSDGLSMERFFMATAWTVPSEWSN